MENYLKSYSSVAFAVEDLKFLLKGLEISRYALTKK